MKEKIKIKNKKKKDVIICKGKVLEAYPNTRFLVELEEYNTKINATLSGRLKQNFIKILVGDKVEIELSIYDLTQGRISKRF